MYKLAYTARLLKCKRKIPFLSSYWSWVEGLLVLGCRPLSAASRVSHANISVSNSS